MFKFELNDTIYYLRANKVYSAPVLARMWVENAHPDWNLTNVQREMYQPFGEGREVYGTCHGIVHAEDAHATPQALAYCLIQGL